MQLSSTNLIGIVAKLPPLDYVSHRLHLVRYSRTASESNTLSPSPESRFCLSWRWS